MLQYLVDNRKVTIADSDLHFNASFRKNTLRLLIERRAGQITPDIDLRCSNGGMEINKTGGDNQT